MHFRVCIDQTSLYTNASVAGSATFDSATLGEAVLPPGDYVVHLLKDDGQQILASASFRVSD